MLKCVQDENCPALTDQALQDYIKANNLTIVGATLMFGEAEKANLGYVLPSGACLCLTYRCSIVARAAGKKSKGK